MMPLPAPTLSKLAKIAGLFGSDHAGERAEAARQADKIVRGCGTTWSALLAGSVPAPGHSETSWRRELTPARILATYGHALTDWEKRFLATIVRRPDTSPRQAEILAEIQARFA